MSGNRRHRGAFVAVLTLLLLGPLLLREPASAAPAPARAAVVRTGALVVPAASRCPTRVARVFRPTSITATGVRRAVVAPRRVHGAPGTAAISNSGKRVWAWDRYFVWPGARRGNVLLNAHTWPDGTALGNRLLKRLRPGSQVIVQGGRSKLCYRVTRRIVVPAGYSARNLYSATGRHQLVIVVCSGRRLGPGHWENRTIWFASPSA